MVDTFRPLELGEGGRAVDDGRYAWSWSGRGPDGKLAARSAPDGSIPRRSVPRRISSQSPPATVEPIQRGDGPARGADGQQLVDQVISGEGDRLESLAPVVELPGVPRARARQWSPRIRSRPAMPWRPRAARGPRRAPRPAATAFVSHIALISSGRVPATRVPSANEPAASASGTCPAGRPDLRQGQGQQVRQVGDPGHRVVVGPGSSGNHPDSDGQRQAPQRRPSRRGRVVLDQAGHPDRDRGTCPPIRPPIRDAGCPPSGASRRSGRRAPAAATCSATGPLTPADVGQSDPWARAARWRSAVSRTPSPARQHHQCVGGCCPVQRGVQLFEDAEPVGDAARPGLGRW